MHTRTLLCCDSALDAWVPSVRMGLCAVEAARAIAVAGLLLATCRPMPLSKAVLDLAVWRLLRRLHDGTSMADKWVVGRLWFEVCSCQRGLLTSLGSVCIFASSELQGSPRAQRRRSMSWPGWEGWYFVAPARHALYATVLFTLCALLPVKHN